MFDLQRFSYDSLGVTTYGHAARYGQLVTRQKRARIPRVRLFVTCLTRALFNCNPESGRAIQARQAHPQTAAVSGPLHRDALWRGNV